MAVALGSVVAPVKRTISINDLSGKIVAIDAYNTLYQFLSIIRQPDGTPLMDANGNVTSHLSGIFYRTQNLIAAGVKPIFVFDGLPHRLKSKTIAARMSHRQAAYESWQKAKENGDLEEARTKAMASSRVNKSIVESGKELMKLMGIQIVQAPGEGEAQASRMVSEGFAYSVASQDYDVFLFGANVVTRNLTISGRRKLPGKNVFVNVQPELVLLDELLSSLQISRKKLVWMGMLMGTDFNEGINKVGPKTALKIVKNVETLEDLVAYVKTKYSVDMSDFANEVQEIFLKPETVQIDFQKLQNAMDDSKPDVDGIVKFMCDLHGFSRERIEKFAESISKASSSNAQKGINNWM